MAQLIITAAGTAAGFALGGPIGARIGFAVGSAVGGSYAASRKRIDGPRLSDAQLVTSQFGAVVPYVLGAGRVAGQVWWQSARRETASTSRAGKGGGPRVTTYTYSQDVLFGLTGNPKGVLLRVWLNGKLIWSAMPDADSETLEASDESQYWGRITFYPGGPDQLPDPTYEAAVGTADALAYRGRSTVFIEDLQLGGSGQIGNFTFEVAGGELGLSTFCLDGASLLFNPDVSIETLYTSSGTASGMDSHIAGFMTLTPPHPEGKPGIRGGNAGSALFDIKTREFAVSDRRIKYIEFDFKLEDRTPTPSTDDGMVLTLLDSDDYPVFSFNPRREIEFDNAGRPVLGFGNGTFSVGSGQLPNQTWLTFRADYSATSNEAIWSIRQMSDNALVLGGTTPAVIPAGRVASRIQFFVDNVGNPLQAAMGTAYVCVDIGLTVSDVTIDGLTYRQAFELLCQRAGMPAGTYDASALDSITLPVRSLVLGQVGSTRAAMEVLAAAAPIVAQLSDKLYFRPVTSAPVLTVPYEHLAAGREQALQQPLAIQQASELELPGQVLLRYRNVSNDYQDGAEASDRLLSTQAAQQLIDLPLGLTPSEAKAVADSTAIDSVAALTTCNLSLPLAYARAEAGDVVEVGQRDGGSLLLRLLTRTDDRAVLSYTARLHDASALTALGITDEGYTSSGTVRLPSDTMLQPMDIPLLRLADDQPGYYVAVKPGGPRWGGTQVFSSASGGNFSPLVEIADRAVFGEATSALANYTGGGVDESNSVLVDVGDGELSSTTLDALLTDQTVNAGLLGSEVLRWVDATLISTSPNVYRLRRLLRGQRGTEWARSGHAIGDRFVALGTQGLRRIVTDQTEVGAPRVLRAVTLGRPLATGADVPFTNSGESQRPLSVAMLRISKPAPDTYIATWQRRSRHPVVWRDGAPISLPLAESSERYQFEVRDDAGALVESGQVTSPTVTLLQGMSPAPDIDGGTLTVWQMSGAVGRGRPASLVIVDDGKPPPDNPPEAVSLYAALRSWWSLDENDSGSSYADLHGANPLTLRTGGSTTATSAISSNAATDARIGRGAAMARTINRAAYIPRSTTAMDLTNTSQTCGGWMRVGQAASTTSFVMGRVGTNGLSAQLYMVIEGSDGTLRVDATTDGTTATRVRTPGTTAWSASEMQLVTCTLDRANNEIVLRMRRPGANSGNMIKQSAAFAGALFTGSTAANFAIGHALSSDSTFFSGDRNGIFAADEAFFFDSAITDAEFNYLYNIFIGRSYAQLVADAT